MPKPIDKLSFWKERIDGAKKEGVMHYSVYLKHTMADIDVRHREIVRKLGINKPGIKVLDAGCGYGRTCGWFHTNDYVGVDFSPDFVEEARRQYPAYTFAQVDVLSELPFEHGQFDWAICVSIKQMVEGNMGKEAWEVMMKNLKKVVKNVLILEYTSPEIYEVL